MAEFIASQGSERDAGNQPESQFGPKPIDAPLVVEDPTTVPAEEAKKGLSKGKRWMISAATGTVMLIGAGLTAVGIYGREDDVPPPTSGDVTQGNGNEYVPIPYLERYKGLAEAENFFNKDNIKPISVNSLEDYESKRPLNSEIILLPIPFNPEGQNIKSNLYEMSFDRKTPPTTGVLTFTGIESGTEVYAPISGSIELLELNVPEQKAKVIVFRTEKDNKSFLVQLIVPDDGTLNINKDEKKIVNAGDVLFTFGETTKLNEEFGQSLEIHAFTKEIGKDDVDLVTQGINILSEEGKALFIKK